MRESLKQLQLTSGIRARLSCSLSISCSLPSQGTEQPQRVAVSTAPGYFPSSGLSSSSQPPSSEPCSTTTLSTRLPRACGVGRRPIAPLQKSVSEWLQQPLQRQQGRRGWQRRSWSSSGNGGRGLARQHQQLRLCGRQRRRRPRAASKGSSARADGAVGRRARSCARRWRSRRRRARRWRSRRRRAWWRRSGRPLWSPDRG
jgi:hypothetical protein